MAPPVPAERRQLSVVFCDLVDSTALARQLDPEELRELVRAYQGACTRAVRRLEGYVAQYLGDGVLVYFGYPQAHEDDARRAVTAALDIVDAIGALNHRLAGDRRLAVRIGVHTGPVVVGEVGSDARREQLALGDAINVAARLQELAEPNTVVTSDATLRIVQDLFVTELLGTPSLKGLDAPVTVHRVLRPSGLQSRLDVAVARGLTPLVGRDRELALLRERWERVKTGEGHVVLIGGEAGIGKSRLVHAFRQGPAAESPSAWVEGRCSAHGRTSPLAPVIEVFQQATRWTDEVSPVEQLRRLEAVLEATPFRAAEHQRQKTFELFVAPLRARAGKRPVVLVIEDLHWADASTLEILTLLATASPDFRLLTLLTFRSDFRPPWSSQPHHTSITLNRLPHAQVAAMAAGVVGGKSLPAEIVAQVAAKTDGVPLFVEELTKMVVEAGLVRERNGQYELSGRLPRLDIPTTLQDSLMARLDRLGPVKEIAQVMAVLGREFSDELLRAVAPHDEATLRDGIARLVEAELLYAQAPPADATYVFKHALIQEIAYQSLLKSQRKTYHRLTAQVLANGFPDVVANRPELLAHHYTEAGLLEPAIDYWQRAGDRAARHAAHAEAIAHLTMALTLLERIDDTPQRALQELALLTLLGPSLIASKGHAAPEVERAYTRALALCKQVGGTVQIFSTLVGLWSFYLMRTQLHTARELAEQISALAESVSYPLLKIVAHTAHGLNHQYLGNFARARADLAQALALYDPVQHRAYGAPAALDPEVVVREHLADVTGLLGYPDQAAREAEEAVAAARAVAHPPSVADALLAAALIAQRRRDVGLVGRMTDALIALAEEQGFPLYHALGTILRGWTLVEQGDHARGIEDLRRGETAYAATGAELGRASFLSWLAEAYASSGRPAEGIPLVDEGLAAAEQTGLRYVEAELHRLKGELLLKRVNSPQLTANSPAPSAGCQLSSVHLAEAEACFVHACDVARQQEARWWELRATLSLAQLWKAQGRRDAARERLAPIYAWFTEGFASADLVAARALLDELNS